MSKIIVTVAGEIGSGKSAIAGEIEVALKAIGVPVFVQERDTMVVADYQTWIDLYKPEVTIHELNVPKAAPISDQLAMQKRVEHCPTCGLRMDMLWHMDAHRFRDSAKTRSSDSITKEIETIIYENASIGHFGDESEVENAAYLAREIVSHLDGAAQASCGCGPMCEDKGSGNCRYADVTPTRKALRHLVDAVWQHATESTAVPSTDTVDRLISSAIIPSHDASSLPSTHCGGDDA